MIRRIPIGALVGTILVGGMTLAVLFAPWLAPNSQTELVGEVWAPPGPGAPLGLDNLGRDLLSRLLIGGQVTLLVTLLATVISVVVGSLLGFVAAILGGWVDIVLARAVDAVLAIPTLILALVLLTVLGTSVPLLILIIAVVSSTRAFRVSRSLGGNIVVMDYFEAARLRRETLPWLIVMEVLPNAAAPLLAEFGLRLCGNFLFIASLSFLGLGIQPPFADWGGMVHDNAGAITFGGTAPLIPAAAIGLYAIGINLLVDWILARRNGLPQ